MCRRRVAVATVAWDGEEPMKQEVDLRTIAVAKKFFDCA
jgi:hypothetical protein